MTAKVKQEIPEGASRPRASTAPELPMMNSERRELLNKIRELEEDHYMIGTIVLHEVTRIVNVAEYLSEEQKVQLLSEIWKNRKGQHP